MKPTAKNPSLLKKLQGNHKAQMELLGIAVVVVFLAFGIFLVIKFNIIKEPTDTKKTYVQTELSSNMLGAIMSTTVSNCSNNNLRDIMIDCANNYDKTSFMDSGSKLCKYYQTNRTCEAMNLTLIQILAHTLNKWGNSYNLSITTVSGVNKVVVWSKSKGSCSGEKKSSQFFFETDKKGTMLIKLDICG